MSIYPGDRPLSRHITDREFRTLELVPELIEALERAEIHLSAMADVTTEQYGIETLSPMYKESLIMVQEAIAKAKGEMR